MNRQLENQKIAKTQWSICKNILLVRLDNLGDVLLTTPAFHAIKTAIPGVRLTLLASPAGAQVADVNPDIDEVLIYSAPWMDPWHKLPQSSQREQDIIAQVRARCFDGAIIFTSFRQSPLPAAYLCYLADIPLRAAASIDGPGSLLTTRHKHPEHMMHEVERSLDLVGSLGISSSSSEMVLEVSQTTTEALMTRLDLSIFHTRRPLIVVHPGCSMPARTYPWEMYAQVISLLVTQLDAYVALTGTTEEQTLIQQILQCMSADERHAIISLVGMLSFAELCALIQQAKLTVTNNTGPMHVAAAVKTPVVVLFALTNPPEEWGPWHVPHKLLYHDVACRICYQRICPYEHECLSLVSPQMVVEAALELLESSAMLPNLPIANNNGQT